MLQPWLQRDFPLIDGTAAQLTRLGIDCVDQDADEDIVGMKIDANEIGAVDGGTGIRGSLSHDETPFLSY